MSKSIFTIRKRKKAKHPYVIVDANKTKFGAMSLTHEERIVNKKTNKSHKNLPLKNNPNPNDIKPAYLRKQLIQDFKFNFSKAFKNYHISDEDAINILKYLENKKKK